MENGQILTLKPKVVYSLNLTNIFLTYKGLKECMVRAYSYIEGIEEVLHRLKLNNYEIHAFTNYPVWLVVNILILFSF
jgi:hypothetical protein